MMEFTKPNKEPDFCYETTILGSFMYMKFWWKEQVMISNNGTIYRFDDKFDFWFKHENMRHIAFMPEQEFKIVKKEYVTWLLETEIIKDNT